VCLPALLVSWLGAGVEVSVHICSGVAGSLGTFRPAFAADDRAGL